MSADKKKKRFGDRRQNVARRDAVEPLSRAQLRELLLGQIERHLLHHRDHERGVVPSSSGHERRARERGRNDKTRGAHDHGSSSSSTLLADFARDTLLDHSAVRSLAQELAPLILSHARRLGATDACTSPDDEAMLPFTLEALGERYKAMGRLAIDHAVLASFVHFAAARHHRHVQAPSPASSTTTTTTHTLRTLADLARLTDRRRVADEYGQARALRRKVILHVGPTNSGKTYNALLALSKARTGVYSGPLRLLAHEVFTRFNHGQIGNMVPRPCNLVTGEEVRTLDPDARLQSCTVEMTPTDRLFDVAVVDEIQMIADPDRGQAWAHAVLGLLATEIHLCGEDRAVPAIENLLAHTGDELVIRRYERLSPLKVARESLHGDYTAVRKRDCVVTFSRSNIFAVKQAIEQATKLKVAVAYGGLPPELREHQARLFNEGHYDVLVASDAVGMGLNL